MATYSCDGDLVIVGNEMRTCGPRSVDASVNGEVGVWSGSDPMCGKSTYYTYHHLVLFFTIYYPICVSQIVYSMLGDVLWYKTSIFFSDIGLNLSTL